LQTAALLLGYLAAGIGGQADRNVIYFSAWLLFWRADSPYLTAWLSGQNPSRFQSQYNRILKSGKEDQKSGF
jgi:hypothetical protein